jgi:hypothetical protein
MTIMTMLSAGLAMATAPTSTEITVYNQGFGLVKELRTLSLKQGRQTVAVEDVAAMIEPTSVGIRSLTDPTGLNVLEQNYQYDLISPLAILNKSVGQRVTFIRTLGNTRDTLVGTLLSAPTAIVGGTDGNHNTYNGLVIKTDDGRIVLDPTGEIQVNSIPDGLISKPTLLWDLEAAKGGENQVELSYLTQGISWRADYVLNLSPDSKTADLRGWVTMDNQSGATFTDAKLKLLAGDVNRATAPRAMQDLMIKEARFGAPSGGFQEESLFEYHLYSLQRPATIKNREIKQLSLLEGKGIKVQKNLIVNFDFGRNAPSESGDGAAKLNPSVELEFKNTMENGLGMPIPKGILKVYQTDKSGSVQMLGEDNVDHTPRNESIKLKVGRAFDVVANRKRTDFKRLSDRSFRQTFEIEVRNRKQTEETITVLESAYGQWKVVSKNVEFTKLSNERLQFVVKVGADEAKKIVYSIETTW